MIFIPLQLETFVRWRGRGRGRGRGRTISILHWYKSSG